MNRAEIKARARQALGNGIFQTNWIMSIVAILVYALISGASSVTYVGQLILYGPLTFGLVYVFMKQSRDGQQIQLGDLFKGFSEDFGGNLVLGLLITIFTALWSLLFVIPGIIKGYSWKMSFYIKADHPEYGWKECMDASAQMMNGHKMELFILELSFIGWAIVGSLCLGVGSLWVSAYMQAAEAEFYKEISQY